MAGRRSDVLDVREMLRRFRLGQSTRQIARDLGTSRNTVRGYLAWFREKGFLDGDPAVLPEAAELAAHLAQATSETGPPPTLAPYRDEIAGLVGLGLQLKVAWERFCAAHPDVRVGVTAFRRFVRRHVAQAKPEPCIRIEVEPGAEAQVDFGYAGLIPPAPGEAPKKTWVFVMTLSHSRHQYVELVPDQAVPTWLTLHRNAFAFFGGVVRKVVLDNLKAGIVRASVTDPEVQRAYRECAEHYGFVISPCVARTPEHKGKVERGVQYVKRSFLAGRNFESLAQANEAALAWVLEIAGPRTHGTTREVPLTVFGERERPALLPLPAPFELVEYKQVKLHPDCHVVFSRSYYSAPHAHIGRRLWLRATSRVVQLFVDHQLVRTHVRSYRPGARVQNPADFPQEKMRYHMQHPSWCRERAREIGTHVGELVARLLADRTLDRLRGAQATLRLADAFGRERLDAACARALACDAVTYHTVKSILTRGLDREPLPGAEPVATAPATREHARTFFDLFNQGDHTWTSSTN
jgi:transposase